MPDPIRSVISAGPIEVPQAEQPRSSSGADTPPQSSRLPPTDSADISRTEALLATISAVAADVPTIDAARVAELQRAIQAGTYRIDARQIAEKIVGVEKLLSPVPGSQ